MYGKPTTLVVIRYRHCLSLRSINAHNPQNDTVILWVFNGCPGERDHVCSSGPAINTPAGNSAVRACVWPGWGSMNTLGCSKQRLMCSRTSAGCAGWETTAQRVLGDFEKENKNCVGGSHMVETPIPLGGTNGKIQEWKKYGVQKMASCQIHRDQTPQCKHRSRKGGRHNPTNPPTRLKQIFRFSGRGVLQSKPVASNRRLHFKCRADKNVGKSTRPYHIFFELLVWFPTTSSVKRHGQKLSKNVKKSINIVR